MTLNDNTMGGMGLEVLNGSLLSRSAITTTGREETHLIFPGILATFTYLSFTTEEELILQTTKESALKDREGKALPLDL